MLNIVFFLFLRQYHMRYSTTANSTKPVCSFNRLSKIQDLLKKVIHLQKHLFEKAGGSGLGVDDESDFIRNNKILHVTSDGKFAEEIKRDQKQYSLQMSATHRRKIFIWKPPKEKQCMEYLKTFKRSLLKATFHRIKNFLEANTILSSQKNVPISQDQSFSVPSDVTSVSSTFAIDSLFVKPNDQEKAFECDRSKCFKL